MMRGILTLAVMALIVVNLFNCWQVWQLQQQVAGLQAHIGKTEAADKATTSLLTKAMPLLEQARSAAQKADFEKARRLLAQATTNVNQFSRLVDEKSAPGVAWVRQQVQTLEDKIAGK